MPTRSASRGAHGGLGANQGRAWQAQVAKVPHTDLAEPLAIALRYRSNVPRHDTRLRIATRLGPTLKTASWFKTWPHTQLYAADEADRGWGTRSRGEARGPGGPGGNKWSL